MERCRKCGHELTELTTICPKCGASTTARQWWIAALVVVAVIVFSIYNCLGIGR